MGTLENHLQQFLSREERVWPRLKCNYVTECNDARGNQWACKIVNISYRGLGVILSAALRKGDTVSIADPRTKAIVVWVAEDRVGLRVCN
ncbi:MAG: PilZ domain-containing protein [Dissulfurispiraceae bacterium]|jgi:hypothetical protein